MRKKSRTSKSARAASTRSRQAVLIDAQSPRLVAAQNLLRAGRHADALDLYREAIRQEPNNVRTYVLTARAHAELFQFERMEEVHQKLKLRAPNHPGVHHYIGETFGHLRLPYRAIDCFEKAASIESSAPPTWMELASLYESAHRLDEASELIERTVSSGYDAPLVWLVRGRIQRRSKYLESAEATFRELINQAPESEWAAQAWGEIALMKDGQGDYAGAVDAIRNCKQLQMTREERFLKPAEQARQRIRPLFNDLSRQDLRKWRYEAEGQDEIRLAVLTGLPRSGTTLLEQLLDAHPDLVSSEERDYIGRELMRQVVFRQGSTPLLDLLNQLTPRKLKEGRERYLPAMEYLLGEEINGRIHLDKNPAYNLTLPLLLRFFPFSRLIVALRDPRDVVLSCYLRYLPLNSVSVHFMSPQRTAEKYAFDMRAWLRMRELIETPWCEVRYEDTVADAGREAKRALELLELEWNDDVLNYRQRLGRDKMVTSPTYEAVAQPLHQGAINRWKNYEEFLAPAFETLAPFIREFGYS